MWGIQITRRPRPQARTGKKRLISDRGQQTLPAPVVIVGCPGLLDNSLSACYDLGAAP